MSLERTAMKRGPPLIALLVTLLFAVGYAVSRIVGIPPDLGLPLPVRLLGLPFIFVGLWIAGLTFSARGIREVLVSTYVTLWKAVKGTPLDAQAGREEPLIIRGPYRYVRSPLYLGVVVVVFGFGLLSPFSFILVTDAVLFAWFRLILIPFEERELAALFGSQFQQYKEEVPALIPFTKTRRRTARAPGAYGSSQVTPEGSAKRLRLRSADGDVQSRGH